MKIQVCILFSCIGSWALVSFMFPQAAVEILLGMLGPLLLAIGTLILVERTYRKAPRKLTSLMTQAFFGKMLFYGVYVGVIVGFYSFQALPFAVSFTVYFIGLHLTEALYFQALFRAESRPRAVENGW
ncbi:MAG: hypothetical protein V3S50_10705 [Acidobacteriota bacterium]